MANPSKHKGTDGETELLRLLNERVGPFLLRRSPSGALADLYQDALDGSSAFELEDMIDVLATRPDFGEWLVTLRATDLREILYALWANTGSRLALRIEVKRYKRFSLHTIFAGKFRKERTRVRLVKNPPTQGSGADASSS